MRAQVIDIGSVSRPTVHEWEREAMLSGFTKALALIRNLNCRPTIEARATVERMAMEGILSVDERAAVAQFFGWERAP
jgi:hypothetical protein